MKKFIGLTLFWFLVLFFGTTAYAQKLDFKASGFIDAASFLARNVPYAYDVPNWSPFYAWLPPLYGPSPLFNPASTTGGAPALNRSRSLMQTRARLKFDAVTDKNVSGTIFFEMDSPTWGDVDGTRNSMGYFTGDRAALEIKNVYIDFGVPAIPIPTTVRIGLQPLSIRPHMVVYDDGMGITAGIKIDPLTIQPLWFKALEGRTYSADDVDIYGLQLFTKIQQFTIGGYGLYYKQNTYPLFSASYTTGFTPPEPDINASFKSDMWWLGIYADGKAGLFNLNFDFVIDTGKVEDNRHVVPTFRDVKYRGWATRLSADYPWEKFNFGVVGLYASGSDQKKTDFTGIPGQTTPFGTTTTRVSGYLVPTASEQFAYGESLILTGSPIWSGFLGYNVLNYRQMHRGSIGGTWVAKLYGSYKAAPWYKFTLAGIYIGDTTENGNTLGNARRSNGLPRDDKTIGFEADLINEINIYKNLKFDIGLGYLFASDALEYFDAAANRNKDGKDPWAFITRLTYTF